MRTTEGKPAEKRPAGKAPAKAVSGIEKRKAKSHHHKGQYNLRSAIKRIIKNTYQATSPPQISGPVIDSLANISHEIIEKLAQDCSILARKVGKQTINLEEVVAAIQLNFMGELRIHTQKEIKEAIAKVPTKSSK